MIREKREEQTLDSYRIVKQLGLENHILLQIKKNISFDFVEDMLKDQYTLDRGRKAHNPILMFKLVFLQYFYDRTTRQTEELGNQNIVAKCFLELEMEERAPDHTRIADFIHFVGEKKMKLFFTKILLKLKEKNIIGANIGFVDSTHLVAEVDLKKVHNDIVREEKEAIEKVRKTNGNGTPVRWEDVKVELNNENISQRSRDKDARFGRKSEKKGFFGYKAHTAVDLESTIITDYEVTSGEKHDGAHMMSLLGETTFKAVTADKGYDDSTNHYELQEKVIKDFIALKRYEKNVEAKKHEEYRNVLRMRSCGERVFSITKNRYGMKRCRYLGQVKTTVQIGMTYLVHNVVQAVRLMQGLTGRLTLPQFTPAVSVS